MSSDWAVIEQNMLLHSLELSNHDPAGIPGAFRDRCRYWRKLVIAAFPERLREIEALHRRLRNRSMARNYAIHGYWRQLGPNDFRVIWLEFPMGQVVREELVTTRAEIEEQVHKIRSMRSDFVTFLRELRQKPPAFRPGVPGVSADELTGP